MDRHPAQLDGWFPIRLYWQASQVMLDWCYLGDLRFTEPFFEQTVAAALRHPFAAVFRHQTPIELLEELDAQRPGVPLAGLIFHMSRCGSTLIAQMLAALPTQIVLSEAPVLDMALRTRRGDPRVSEAQRIAWLRGLVSALCRPPSGQEQRAFIKLDSWHTLDLPLIRRAFPETPWIFVYRDPVEVLVSHQRQPGSQMVPGGLDPALLGLDLAGACALPQQEYRARLLERICASALEASAGQPGALLSYRQLPEAFGTHILPRFGVELSEAELALCRDAARADAKRPAEPFAPDSERKRAEASEDILEAARRLAPLYAALETRRTERSVPLT